MHPKVRSFAKSLRFISAAALVYLSPASFADDKQTLAQLNQLVEAKSYQQAFDLANQHIMDLGGEPRFDYLMGMAALNIKAYEESVFAFERAVINKPKWEQARFQLAKAYYHVDNLAASRTELVKLKSDSKTPKFIALIDRFILQVDEAKLNKKRQFKQIVSLSSGFDSNINSGTTESSVFLDQLEGTLVLAEGSKETEDTPFNLSYQAQYQEPLNQNALIIAGLGLYRTDYADSPAFERTLADVSLKYQDVLAGMTYQVGGFYRPMELDGDHYRDQMGILTNWSLPLDNNWSVGWQLGLGTIESRVSDSLDLEDAYGSVSGKYRNGRWQHTLAANLTEVKAKLDQSKHRNHTFFKLDYQLGYLINDSQYLSFDSQWQKLNYDEIDPAFLIVRDEEFWRAGLSWRYLQNEWMMWQVQVRHSEKTSNQAIFAYERDEAILSLTLQF
jgi:hypothetical protein